MQRPDIQSNDFHGDIPTNAELMRWVSLPELHRNELLPQPDPLESALDSWRIGTPTDDRSESASLSRSSDALLAAAHAALAAGAQGCCNGADGSTLVGTCSGGAVLLFGRASTVITPHSAEVTVDAGGSALLGALLDTAHGQSAGELRSLGAGDSNSRFRNSCNNSSRVVLPMVQAHSCDKHGQQCSGSLRCSTACSILHNSVDSRSMLILGAAPSTHKQRAVTTLSVHTTNAGLDATGARASLDERHAAAAAAATLAQQPVLQLLSCSTLLSPSNSSAVLLRLPGVLSSARCSSAGDKVPVDAPRAVDASHLAAVHTAAAAAAAAAAITMPATSAAEQLELHKQHQNSVEDDTFAAQSYNNMHISRDDPSNGCSNVLQQQHGMMPGGGPNGHQGLQLQPLLYLLD